MSKYQEALNFLDWHCEVSHVEQQELLQELVDKENKMTQLKSFTMWKDFDYLSYTVIYNEKL